eukprot:TRINITY_DN36258_c0_g1_i2.p1 TRINITY_DN36258_c0_g1~~TRINITY_DN36258_c0_g1_i2.p1  ORF type:complete len:1661 (+),score=224.74 TRINITY_DN36258_c0_g1_i2:94-4983(+)
MSLSDFAALCFAAAREADPDCLGRIGLDVNNLDDATAKAWNAATTSTRTVGQKEAVSVGCVDEIAAVLDADPLANETYDDVQFFVQKAQRRQKERLQHLHENSKPRLLASAVSAAAWLGDLGLCLHATTACEKALVVRDGVQRATADLAGGAVAVAEWRRAALYRAFLSWCQGVWRATRMRSLVQRRQSGCLVRTFEAWRRWLRHRLQVRSDAQKIQRRIGTCRSRRWISAWAALRMASRLPTRWDRFRLRAVLHAWALRAPRLRLALALVESRTQMWSRAICSVVSRRWWLVASVGSLSGWQGRPLRGKRRRLAAAQALKSWLAFLRAWQRAYSAAVLAFDSCQRLLQQQTLKSWRCCIVRRQMASLAVDSIVARRCRQRIASWAALSLARRAAQGFATRHVTSILQVWSSWTRSQIVSRSMRASIAESFSMVVVENLFVAWRETGYRLRSSRRRTDAIWHQRLVLLIVSVLYSWLGSARQAKNIRQAFESIIFSRMWLFFEEWRLCVISDRALGIRPRRALARGISIWRDCTRIKQQQRLKTRKAKLYRDRLTAFRCVQAWRIQSAQAQHRTSIEVQVVARYSKEILECNLQLWRMAAWDCLRRRHLGHEARRVNLERKKTVTVEFWRRRVVQKATAKTARTEILRRRLNITNGTVFQSWLHHLRSRLRKRSLMKTVTERWRGRVLAACFSFWHTWLEWKSFARTLTGILRAKRRQRDLRGSLQMLRLVRHAKARRRDDRVAQLRGLKLARSLRRFVCCTYLAQRGKLIRRQLQRGQARYQERLADEQKTTAMYVAAWFAFAASRQQEELKRSLATSHSDGHVLRQSFRIWKTKTCRRLEELATRRDACQARFAAQRAWEAFEMLRQRAARKQLRRRARRVLLLYRKCAAVNCWHRWTAGHRVLRQRVAALKAWRTVAFQRSTLQLWSAATYRKVRQRKGNERYERLASRRHLQVLQEVLQRWSSAVHQAKALRARVAAGEASLLRRALRDWATATVQRRLGQAVAEAELHGRLSTLVADALRQWTAFTKRRRSVEFALCVLMQRRAGILCRECHRGWWFYTKQRKLKKMMPQTWSGPFARGARVEAVRRWREWSGRRRREKRAAASLACRRVGDALLSWMRTTSHGLTMRRRCEDVALQRALKDLRCGLEMLFVNRFLRRRARQIRSTSELQAIGRRESLLRRACRAWATCASRTAALRLRHDHFSETRTWDLVRASMSAWVRLLTSKRQSEFFVAAGDSHYAVLVLRSAVDTWCRVTWLHLAYDSLSERVQRRSASLMAQCCLREISKMLRQRREHSETVQEKDFNRVLEFLQRSVQAWRYWTAERRPLREQTRRAAEMLSASAWCRAARRWQAWAQRKRKFRFVREQVNELAPQRELEMIRQVIHAAWRPYVLQIQQRKALQAGVVMTLSSTLRSRVLRTWQQRAFLQQQHRVVIQAASERHQGVLCRRVCHAWLAWTTWQKQEHRLLQCVAEREKCRRAACAVGTWRRVTACSSEARARCNMEAAQRLLADARDCFGAWNAHARISAAATDALTEDFRLRRYAAHAKECLHLLLGLSVCSRRRDLLTSVAVYRCAAAPRQRTALRWWRDYTVHRLQLRRQKAGVMTPMQMLDDSFRLGAPVLV